MNELHKASSPYLQQHKDNPVHWRIWGAEALAEARQSHQPILLSIGYAACHWCHVMAHESFQDENIAQIINTNFLPIKVDREERPDIDAYYMQALHDLGQQGGWPLTMFLDENAAPIWGGTYFPNPARQGMPGFADVLLGITALFRETPDKVAQNREALKQAGLSRTQRQRAGSLAQDLPLRMAKQLANSFDLEKGGLQGAPKFPNVPMLDFLWRIGLRHHNQELKNAVLTTLDALCHGGIYDHLGGGFARYAVDENWHIPHFEKMLYDNALLISLMAEVWRETHNPLYRQRISETIDWLNREMITADGCAAALDADQTDEHGQNQEGAFYAWRTQDIDSLLGDQADLFKQAYGVSAQGNWENGLSVLYQKNSYQKNFFDEEKDQALRPLRQILLAHRLQRPKPQRDDKIIAHWNGLMIMALAHAAWVFDQKDWLESAKKIFAAVKNKLSDETHRLAHSSCDGDICAAACADDYAAMIMAAISLHQATGEQHYLQTAQTWSEVFDLYYWDTDQSGYFMTAHDQDDVPVRLCNAQDGPWPAANGLIWRAHALMFALSGKKIHAQRAEALARGFGADVAKNFPQHAAWLSAHDLWHHPMQIVLVGSQTTALENALRELSLPDVSLIKLTESKNKSESENLHRNHPAFGKKSLQHKATAYICLGNLCLEPIENAKTFIKQLKEKRSHA